MRNLIYGKWRKEKKKQESVRASLPRLFWRQFERAIDLPVHLLGCLWNADRIPADGGCGWEMRMEENADTKNSKKEKTRNMDGKKNK